MAQINQKLAGSSKTRPFVLGCVRIVGRRSDLAGPAKAPRPAAAAAAGAATAASPAASAATASATAAAAPATPGDLFAKLRRRGVFLVEDVECRQTNVRDLLFTEKDFVIR